jgi:hypothetical protein
VRASATAIGTRTNNTASSAATPSAPIARLLRAASPAQDEDERRGGRADHAQEHRDPVVDLRDRQIRGHVAELVHAAGDRHHLPSHEAEQAEGHQRCRELEPSHDRWPRKLVDHVHYQVLLAQEHRRHAEENGAGEPELDQLEHAAHRIAEDCAREHVATVSSIMAARNAAAT